MGGWWQRVGGKKREIEGGLAKAGWRKKPNKTLLVYKLIKDIML